MEYNPDDFDPVKEDLSKLKVVDLKKSTPNNGCNLMLIEKIQKSVILGQSRRSYSHRCTSACRQSVLIVTDDANNMIALSGIIKNIGLDPIVC